MSSRELTNVADSIARHAEERPWAVAIIDDTGVIHYRTLDAVIWAAAWLLRNAGIRPGDVVGLALPHSALYLIAIYALARIGAVSTALPLSDPAPVRESFARQFGVRSVVAAGDGAGPPGIPTVLLTPDRLAEAPEGIPSEIRVDGGDSPWNIRRTSGTTSEAKGIAVTHRAMLARCQAHMPVFYGPDDRVLSIVSIDTAFGLSACERTLFGGGCIVLPALPTTESQFLDSIDRHAVTHVSLTPNFLNVLLRELPIDACRSPSLRQISITGMAMPENLRSEIRHRFSRGLLVLYATNEAAYLTGANADMQERHPETVGRPLPGVELEIVDDGDRPVAADVAGHVRARTPWMPTGYVNALKAVGNRTFRHGWIYTGDIGVLNGDGMLFIKGRADDMMNFDGIKIMPADIEEVLLAHPAVAEAVAFPVPSSRHQHLPAAAVVLRAPASGEELLAHCRQRLGTRAPLAIDFETAFPRNAMGKVVRRELAEKIARRLPPRLL
ncbi:MAG: long-chain-fatty-acid--CoA ligase [Nitrobacter vulgaris]|nr:long-chain-fatty-acid--CoA ligase [Nitrobacter vulgaris]